jgi:hypothetical protein
MPASTLRPLSITSFCSDNRIGHRHTLPHDARRAAGVPRARRGIRNGQPTRRAAGITVAGRSPRSKSRGVLPAHESRSGLEPLLKKRDPVQRFKRSVHRRAVHPWASPRRGRSEWGGTPCMDERTEPNTGRPRHLVSLRRCWFLVAAELDAGPLAAARSRKPSAISLGGLWRETRTKSASCGCGERRS